MLPSVDSLLACRVILLLISTARPVSVLLWIVLRNFLPPASEHRVTRTTQMTEKEREYYQSTALNWGDASRTGRSIRADYHWRTNAFIGSYKNLSSGENKAHLSEFKFYTRALPSL